MNNRPSIPAQLEREVLIEAGHRCAIPTCRYPRVEIAHIVPFDERNEHKFENLIALCPNCHDLYDKDKRIDRKSMFIYKSNLGLLNNRYGEFELRVLQYFCNHPQKSVILLPGLHEIHVFFLLKDELLVKTGHHGGIEDCGVFSWEEYSLTKSGKQFIESWKSAQSLK